MKRHLNQLIDSLKPLPLQKKNAELKKIREDGVKEFRNNRFRNSDQVIDFKRAAWHYL